MTNAPPTAAAPPMPEVGTILNIPVLQAPTRTTLFPEQFAVGSVAEVVDLILLRNESLIGTQQARVVSTDGQGGIELQPVTFQMQTLLTDIGHVRMNASEAIELAVLLVQHLLGRPEPDAQFASRLQSLLGDSR